MLYADHAQEYADKGWTPLPVPFRKKHSPPVGFTGENGPDPTTEQLNEWVEWNSNDNIAIRLPKGVVGLDVDDYADKPGGKTLATFELRWGVLPPTWVSSSRPLPSGIRFYRVPEWVRLQANPGPGIEAIQRHHRYAVVWPSVHPEDRQYQWMDPWGEIGTEPPLVEDLPELPPLWIDGLAVIDRDIPGDGGSRQRVDGQPSQAVERAVGRGLRALHEHGCRHDAVTASVLALVRLDALGHPGAGDAVETLRRAFTAAVTADGSRSNKDADDEFDRMVTTGEAKVATTSSTRPEYGAWAQSGDLQWVEGWHEPAATVTADGAVDESPPVSPMLQQLRLRTLSLSQAKALKPPPPLVDGWLYRNTVAMTYGPSGGGKTFILVDIASHVASGSWWCRNRVEKGTVLYIAAEGAHGIGRRFDSWEDHRGINLDNHNPVHILSVAPPMMDPAWAQAVSTHAQELQADLVIIDTLARASVGAEENSARDMGIFFEHLDWVRRATGACVLVNHHTGKDPSAGARGSSALRAAMDTEVEILGSDGYIRLKVTKQKEAAEPPDLSFRLAKVGESAVAVSSLPGWEGVTPSTLEVYQDLVDIALNGGATATDWFTYSTGNGRSKSSFYRARKVLESEGMITNLGTESRPRFIPTGDERARELSQTGLGLTGGSLSSVPTSPNAEMASDLRFSQSPNESQTPWDSLSQSPSLEAGTWDCRDGGTDQDDPPAPTTRPTLDDLDW